MNQKLQQAMVAAQSGKSREAQVLLTQVLNEDPEEVQAWFLLSHLVDSEQKQLAYLRKVVELEPGHEKAVDLLTQLEMDDSLPPMAEVDDSSEEILSGTLPDSITAEDEESGLEATVFTRSSLEQEEAAPIPPGLFSDEPLPEAEESALAAPSVKDKVDIREKQRARLTYTLIGLVVATIIVFLALLYFIFTFIIASL